MGISLCMIVKNEQDWVTGAVESVRSIVDEVIIVDTGSTDATPSQVEALGVRLLRYQWSGSFADARNVSLAAARQPWILVLDADERIASRDLGLITSAVKSGAADGFHLIQRNYVRRSQLLGWTPNGNEYEEGSQYDGYVDNPLIRLFRNAPEIRFHGVVHEIVDPNRLPPTFKFASVAVVLHHYGKVRDDERVEAKQRFYLELGLKKIQEDSGNAKAFLDLGIQYQELGLHAEACEHFERNFGMSERPIALLYWAISEKHLRHYEKAAGLLNRARELGLDSLHVHLELGNIHLAQNDWQSALAEYARCLALEPANPVAAFNYGLVLRKTGNTEGAVNFYKRALSVDPKFREPTMELAILYLQAGRPDDALSVLGHVTNIDGYVLSLIGAAYLEKDDLDEAQKHLQRALRKDRSLKDARLNLAQVHSRRGDHARAARYVQSVSVQ